MNRNTVSRLSLSLSVLLLAVLSTGVRGDIIVLRDGHEYAGTLVEATADGLTFRGKDGKQTEYKRGDIVHVRLQKRRRWADAGTVAEIADSLLNQRLEAGKTPPRAPGAATLTLHAKTAIRLLTTQTWEWRHREIVQVLTDAGESASVQSVYFRRDAESAQILHGISIRPDGTVSHLRDTAVQTESIYAATPRYDKIVKIRFAMPEGKPGTVLDYKTEVVRNAPSHDETFFGEFLFGAHDPKLDMQLEITSPPGLELRWQLLNDPDTSVQYKSGTKDGMTVHSWSRKASPQLHPEPLMPPLADIVPRVVVGVESGDWNAIAKQCGDTLAACDASCAQPALPEGVTATVEALWEYVSRNISSNGISLGATGYAPGDAGETLALRQGAPLDRTYLYYGWLKSAGTTDVCWSWLRSRGRGALAEDVPHIRAFSTPAVVIDGDSPMFILLGDDLSAFGEPALGQGGTDCVVAGKGRMTVPVAPTDWQGTDRAVAIELSRSGDARVEESITYHGPSARSLRAWRRKTTDEIMNDVRGMVNSVHAGGRDIEYEIKGDIRENAGDLVLKLSYVLPKLADARRSLCSLQPPWLSYNANVVGRPGRQLPLHWDTPFRSSVTVSVQGPGGLQAYAAPPSATCDDGPARLATECSMDGSQSRFSLVYERAALDAPVADYARLKTCLETRASLGRQYWVWRNAKE